MLVFYPLKLPTANYNLIINKNETVHQIADFLEKNNIIFSKTVFLATIDLLHKDKSIYAGLYILKNPISTWHLIERLTNNTPNKISITILSCLDTKAIRTYINNLSNIKHLSLKMSDDELASFLHVSWPDLEGSFFPSTYFIVPNQSDLEIYQEAYKLMQKKLTQIFANHSNNIAYKTPYDMLILGSLIEKETGNFKYMNLVSTVFNNRLKNNMRLQDDPAVFYGIYKKLGYHPKVIERADFKIDTPYNTYIHNGLPPTPICSPSENALLAASSPLDLNLYYFVATGNQKIKFSQTYREQVNTINKIKRN